MMQLNLIFEPVNVTKKSSKFHAHNLQSGVHCPEYFVDLFKKSVNGLFFENEIIIYNLKPV